MNKIAPSELILNQRKAIYHLDLLPEELADTVITVGDPDRVPLVSKYFDSIEFQQQHREFVTHTGWVGRKRISVVSSGIGTDNIDIVLNELDALKNIDFNERVVKPTHTSLNIIRLGTSGSLKKDIPVDSLVVGTHGLGLDNLLHYYRYTPDELEQQILQQFVAHTQLSGNIHPYIFTSSSLLLKHFVSGFHHGITATCPGFYGPQGRILRTGIAYPYLIDHLQSFKYGNYTISNFEMETSAIYGLGKIMGHHCLSVNVIVANRISQTFSENAPNAIDNMIQTCLAIIENI